MTFDSRIALFQDADFKFIEEYGPDDISALLTGRKASFRVIDHAALRTLSRQDTDILVLPYVCGEFSLDALGAMIAFHADGGSLFFLGDLPHKGKWYPLRNMHASKFHLTRCYDDCSISADKPSVRGLTDKGREILGRLEDLDFFKDKSFPCLRITAFPPDEAYPLLAIESCSHADISSAVVAVERRCGEFLGARVAAVGFIGGEPRENVDGAYQLKWKHDPGLLTREWKGIDSMVWSLLQWLEPVRLSASIEARPLAVECARDFIRATVRNLGSSRAAPDLCLRADGKEIGYWKSFSILPGKSRRLPVVSIQRLFGVSRIELHAKSANGTSTLAAVTLRTLSAPPTDGIGFGFSTYWAFQEPKVSEEFKFFCKEMIARGCQYARVNIPWEDVEPSPGKYDWSIPDDMLSMAEAEGLFLQFWMFPTTRGSGLSDGGVPWWSLEEPAIDRNGNKGYFPSIWSPFYRKHYFGMLETFAKRYADHPRLMSFIFDFGNSDFPYGYYYYGGDNTVFDYSPHERAAFAKYLRDELAWPIETVSTLFGRKFHSFDDVPVPFSEENDAFRVYLEFRAWSVSVGVKHVNEIVRLHAPSKLPSDPPGHGLGSIADTSTYFVEAKAKHWLEERKFAPEIVYAHNAPLHSTRWGGEAWQVGATYRQYDDALFQSVRLNASYHTIPGPDLGLYGEDIARIGFIRSELMGATRAAPELAVFDRSTWKGRTLVNIATCLDLPVDLIYAKHRYDFSCYKLMTLPDNDFLDHGGGQLLPTDEQWYWLLRESVEKGLTILVFPKTCEILDAGRVQRTFLRQVFGLGDVKYGQRTTRTIEFPVSFGGGSMRGKACEVRAEGKTLLYDSKGKAVLVRRAFGKGAVLLAGYDVNFDDSIDKFMDFETHARMADHTLTRLCAHLGIESKDYKTDGLFAWKELVRKRDKEYFLVFSHLREQISAEVKVHLSMSARSAIDLATGERIPIRRWAGNWHSLSLDFQPWSGKYIAFNP